MKFIALLRGINVGGHNKVPMAELRSHCAGLGWEQVESYIQSGNIVFSASGTAAAQESALEKMVEKQFGISISVIVRSAKDWPTYVKANPFGEAAETEPNRLMLCLSKAPPNENAAEALLERARDGERVKLVGDALWIHFPGGSGTSKLSPSLMDRLVGSSVTARNWRTVLKIQEMLEA